MTQHFWSRIVSPVRVVLVAMLLLPALVAQPRVAAQEGDAPAFPLQVLSSDGVDVQLLGMDTVDLGAGGGTHLTLERLAVEAETTFQPNPGDAPALIILREGAILSEDERGFFSRQASPFQTVLAAGDGSAWTASEPLTLLRLSMTAKPPAPASADGMDVEVVASLVTDVAATGPTTMFIASASLAPDMASVRLGQEGVTGLAVREGTVELLSPSGLEGRLETGASIVVRAAAPLDVLGTAGTDATMFLFGTTEAADPSALLTATVTDVCRNKDATVCTATGSVLANGETWLHPEGALTVTATTAGSEQLSTWINMDIALTYEHLGDEAVKLTIAPDEISVAYDGGPAWTPTSEEDHVLALNPGERDTIVVSFAPPEGAGDGIISIDVPTIGAVPGARWQGSVAFLEYTAPDSTLDFGQTWVTSTGSLVVNVGTYDSDDPGQLNREISLDATYTNTDTEDLVLQVSPSTFSVTSTGGARWTSNARSVTARIEPGETQSFSFVYRSQPGSAEADIVVGVRQFGPIEDAKWSGPSPHAD